MSRSAYVTAVLSALLSMASPSIAQDLDGDLVLDAKDNCQGVYNPGQDDADLDGYGTFCDGDYDNNGSVSAGDLARWKIAFKSSYLDSVCDHNVDDVISAYDLARWRQLFKEPPPASGLACQGVVPCIGCSFGIGNDSDGDGYEDDVDNCVAVSNGQAPNDQVDGPPADGYGNSCDGDFNDDGSLTVIDGGRLTSCINTSCGEAIYDLNVDGQVNGADKNYWNNLFVAPTARPGPSGLVCGRNYPRAAGFPSPSPVEINVLKSEFATSTAVPAGASYPHLLETAVVAAPNAGNVRITDGQTASFAYLPDPASSAWADEFRLVMSDGHKVTNEFTIHVNLLDGSASFPAELEDRTLVVYNVNAAGALEIAQHYVSQPARDGAHLCPVEMPNGLYASKDQMLDLRKQIVEGCLCPLVAPEDRPQPCEVGPNLAQLAKVSPISHLALVRGLPARMYGTGWPDDEEEPSLDYYLAYLLYRDVDLFCPTCVENPPETIGAVRELYPPIDQLVSYGRIEAITPERTIDLIDRTLAAEASGFTGNLVGGRPHDFGPGNGSALHALRRTSTTDDACLDYFTITTPFVPGDPDSIWPHESCRTGTTLSWVGARHGAIPGTSDSHVPTPVNVGALIGNHPNSADHVVGQLGFMGFERLRKWHRTASVCTELCSELPLIEQMTCRASSTDYFLELNTDCVGAAPGFIGMQYRSWPVGYYGFYPPGWQTEHPGSTDGTPPQILDGEGFQTVGFSDTRYLHVGNARWNAPDASTCNGIPCPEQVALSIQTTVTLDEAIPLAADRDFTVRLRRRHAANPGGDLQVRLTFADGAVSQTVAGNISLATATGSGWVSGQVTLTASAAQLAEIEAITVALTLQLEEGVIGFLDLDAVELIDEDAILGIAGLNLLATEVASFNPSAHEETHRGDFAANLIDRLGGIAAWGSSSHHRTNGHAFSDVGRTIERLLDGVSLGRSVGVGGNGESGIIYGDPIYRPSAALLSPIGSTASKISGPGATITSVFTHPGLVVTQANLAQVRKLAVTALHGTANAQSTLWSISICPELDIKACDDGALWIEDVDGGTQAVRYQLIDWTTYIDPLVDQKVLVRLKVWNAAAPGDALYDFAFFDYQVNGS